MRLLIPAPFCSLGQSDSVTGRDRIFNDQRILVSWGIVQEPLARTVQEAASIVHLTVARFLLIGRLTSLWTVCRYRWRAFLEEVPGSLAGAFRASISRHDSSAVSLMMGLLGVDILVDKKRVVFPDGIA